MLLDDNPMVANKLWRFAERAGETTLGVGLACFFGLVLPSIHAADQGLKRTRDRLCRLSRQKPPGPLLFMRRSA